MPNTLSVSRIVDVNVQLTPAAAAAQSLSNLLLLTPASLIIDSVERYRRYTGLAAVAADFGTSDAAYLAAQKWFAQSPQPDQLLIGLWAQAATPGGLRCGTLSSAQQTLANWTAITAGSFAVQKDGAAATNISAINFSAATSMASVAAIIQTALTATGILCAWNPVYNRFEFRSPTLGATSAVSFLTATGSGTDISDDLKGRSTDGGYAYVGLAAETAVTAVALFDNLVGQQFYGLAINGLTPGANGGADTAALIAVGDYVEAAANKHVMAITTQEAGALSSASTTDIPYQAKAKGYKRVLTQYSSSTIHAAISALGRLLGVNYEGSNTAITLMFKQEPTVVAENLTESQAAALESKNCNVFAAYNNDTSILQQGKMAGGEFADIITGTDWLALTIQRDLHNALYTSTTKIPQTDQGMQVLTTIVAARCSQAVANGLVAPGVWNAPGFGALAQGDYLDKGFYIYNAPVSSQAQADRTARMAVPIQVAAKLAGAIHSVDVTVNVNQ